jgi:transposase
MASPPNQWKDGKEHVNVYSIGKTELGRFLSNFAHTPIDLPIDGHFESIEGYWHWLGTSHPDREVLRGMYGLAAQKAGRKFKDPRYETYKYYIKKDHRFKAKIKAAIRIKIENNKVMKRQFIRNTLPLLHYYVFSSYVKVPADAEWLLKSIESIREEFTT